MWFMGELKHFIDIHQLHHSRFPVNNSTSIHNAELGLVVPWVSCCESVVQYANRVKHVH